MNKELLEFLEMGTYQEKKKWLTSEEKKLIAEERMPFWNRSILNGYLHSNMPQWYFKREFEEILWSGQQEFEAKSKEWNLMNVAKLIESREFRYYFEEGTEVMLDEYTMSDAQKENLKGLIGKKAIVTRCYSDLHAFAKGSAYQHDIEFEDGSKAPSGFDEDSFSPRGFIPTWILKKYEDS